MALHRTSFGTIRTNNVFPPIPDRRFDWSAVHDEEYDGEGSPIGYGRTEKEAIDDLMEQLDEPGAHGQFGVGA